MSWKASVILLGLLAVGACSGADPSSDSRGEGRQPAAGSFKTAPAAGLWSHRFVRWGDGTITAVGFSRKPAGVALVRYLPTGEIDPSFKRIVYQEFGAGKLDALAVAHGGRGRLLIAACQPPDCWGYSVLGRFRRGSLDPAFGENGLVRTSVPVGALEPRALALQRDGKIVVAGELSIEASRRGFLARYLPDGSPDAGFGRDGLVFTQVAAITALAVQADGRIVTAGHRLNRWTRPASSSLEVARYLADGHVDARFGTGGVAPDLAPGSASTLVVDPHGKIVVAGSARRGHRSPAFAITRLTPKGRLDRAFGRGGHVLHRRPGDHAAGVEALTPLRDGSLLATGWATRGGAVPTRRSRLVALAIRSSGAFVRTFAAGGRMTLGGIEARGQAAFQTSRRRLLAVGADDDLEPKQIVFATIRLPS